MQSIKVLIVDDEPRICRGVERLVRGCGEEWQVVAALSDGRQALDFLAGYEGEVDLLITDIRMPEMDGLTLIEKASESYTFQTIVLTGYDDFEYVRTALRGGATDYLLKPMDREQFAMRLAEVKRKVMEQRLQQQQWTAMLLKEEMLKHARQTQTLSYITSTETDLSRLGYWVDAFPEGNYGLLYISLDKLPVKSRSFKDRDWKAYFYALDNMIGEIITAPHDGRQLQGWSWRGSQSDFWTLLHFPANEPAADCNSTAAKMAYEICRAVRTYTPFTVSVSCGQWIDDLYMLPHAKQQALAAMQYRLVSGGNRVFTYENANFRNREGGEGAEGGLDTFTDHALPPLLQKLKRCIEQGRTEAAEDQFKEIFRHIEAYGSPPRILDATLHLVILIHSAQFEAMGGELSAERAEEALLKVREAVDLQELKVSILQMLRQVVQSLADERAQMTAKPVEIAKEWIVSHLNSNLTIKKIADHVHMNPTYFCQQFKLQTGETVLDFVTKVRMERAKELLHNPAAKLQEVSRQVGYQDAKYFSRLFKQYFGELPSRYKELAAGSGRKY
ncbi:response regulator transcription factor [Paenibacillus fonticola]|uniref:response regulator transcription factor n=1 Tax=Paenibacillus fonticola TaxID=379896 RepID=UPI000363232D|nr:response regulator [Paenibacillus fonticola]